MSTSNIRSSLYQCLEQTLGQSALFKLIGLDKENGAYSITMYVSLSSTDTSLVKSANSSMFFEINLTSSSGSIKPNYSIRNANIGFKSDEYEIKLYHHGDAVYLCLPGQMEVIVRKEIKYGQFANLLSSLETTSIDFADSDRICSITNMTEDASNGTYLVDSDGTTVYAKHILPTVNESNVVSGSNIGTDDQGGGGWYENAYIKNLHVGSATDAGSLNVNGSASTESVSVTNKLSVNGNDPSNGAAATAGTLTVDNTLKSSGDATAKYFDVGSGTLSVTGADTTDTKAASVKTLAVSSGTLSVTSDASASSLTVSKTLSVNGDNPTNGAAATAKYLSADSGTLSVTGTDTTSKKAACVKGLAVSNGTLSVGDGGTSTKTLSTTSLEASGSVSVTGSDSLNYSGISSAVTTNNNEDKPVWISKGKAGSDNKGIPTIADGLTYNPGTETLTATNFSGSLKGSAVDSSSNKYASTVSTDGIAGSDYVSAVSKDSNSSEISVTRSPFKALKLGSGSTSISYTPNEEKTITFNGSATSVSDSGDTITITSTDTKNTAGSTNTNEEIYLVGVKQSGDPQETFIHSDVSLASTTSSGDTSYLKIGTTSNSEGYAKLYQTRLNIADNNTKDECSLTPLSLSLTDYASTSSRSLRLNVDTTNSQPDYFYIADNSSWGSSSITKSFKITSALGLEFQYTEPSSTYTTLSFDSETGVFNLSGANSSNTITLAPKGLDSNFISGAFDGGQYKINYTTSGVFQLWNNASNSFSVTASGAVTAASYNATSDRRLKENISDYTCSKSILDLPIKKFDFIDGPKNQIGCIAQDLQEICPDIVHENSDGYLSIQESKIVYLLLQEVKTQKDMIKALEAKIYTLSEKISKQ